jgi:hypothetical protein
MANLAMLFKQAEKQLTYTGLRQSDTMEILELRDAQGHFIQGIAWRPLSGSNVLQFYPTYTESSQSFWNGDDFVVIKGSKSEYRYHDPYHKLVPNQWHYAGCSNCSNLSEDVVLGWILQAYKYLVRDKGIKYD